MPLPSARYLWRMIFRALFNRGWKERALAGRKLREAVTKFENRKIHYDLTPEILQSIDDDDLIQAVYDCVEARLPEGPIDAVPSNSDLPPLCIAVYQYRRMDGDVWNGGFDQYLDGASSALVSQTIDGLRGLGLPRVADVIAEAQCRSAARKSTRQCDNDYAELHPSIEPHIIRFIRDHPNAFTTRVS